MKICLVTAFAPSRRGLNEYGFHIARELQPDPLPGDLAGKVLHLLGDPRRQCAMAEQNFLAALRMTMPQIFRQYLRSLHQKSRALEPISRFRRIPAWIPSRSAIFRAAAPRWSAWT